MTWGCTTRGRTPAMICTDYDRAAGAPSLRPDQALRPPLALAPRDEEGEAFFAWLGHVEAGRIAVR